LTPKPVIDTSPLRTSPIIPSPSIGLIYSSTFSLDLEANLSIPDLVPTRTRPIIGLIKSLCLWANVLAFTVMSPNKPSPLLCLSSCSGCIVSVIQFLS
jgi:hypothetical protein